jgi:hypothetical protein
MLVVYARDAWHYSPAAKALYWITLSVFIVAALVLAWVSSVSLPIIWIHTASRSTAREDKSSTSGDPLTAAFHFGEFISRSSAEPLCRISVGQAPSTFGDVVLCRDDSAQFCRSQ